MGKDHTLYSLIFGRVAFFKHAETKRTHVRVVTGEELLQDALVAQQAKERLPFLSSDPLSVQNNSSL
jgi:hypothetical protein